MFKVGDKVCSTIRRGLFGTVAKIIDNKYVLVNIKGKDMLFSVNYLEKGK